MTDTPADAPAPPRRPRKKAKAKKAPASKKTRARKKPLSAKNPTRKKAAPQRRPTKRGIDPSTDPWCGLRDERHVEIAEAYLADPRRSQTAAYLVGFPDSSRAAAQVSSSRLFATAHMRAYLEKRRQEIAETIAVTPEKVMDELAALAFADPGEFLEWGPDGVQVKRSDQIPAQLRRAVHEVRETYNKHGQRSITVKLSPKVPALDLLGKALDLWREARGDTGPALVVNL